jgi:hypothetical protein
MEAMLGISLYSYPYLKLTKTVCLSYYYSCLLFNKVEKRAEQALPEREGGGGERKGAGGRGRNGPNNVCTNE